MMSFRTCDSEDHHTESRGAGTAPLARAGWGTEDLLMKLPIPPLCHWLQTPTEPQGPCLILPQSSTKGSVTQWVHNKSRV